MQVFSEGKEAPVPVGFIHSFRHGAQVPTCSGVRYAGAWLRLHRSDIGIHSQGQSSFSGPCIRSEWRRSYSMGVPLPLSPLPPFEHSNSRHTALTSMKAPASPMSDLAPTLDFSSFNIVSLQAHSTVDRRTTMTRRVHLGASHPLCMLLNLSAPQPTFCVTHAHVCAITESESLDMPTFEPSWPRALAY